MSSSREREDAAGSSPSLTRYTTRAALSGTTPGTHLHLCCSSVLVTVISRVRVTVCMATAATVAAAAAASPLTLALSLAEPLRGGESPLSDAPASPLLLLLLLLIL
jgi:hypothetical protein